MNCIKYTDFSNICRICLFACDMKFLPNHLIIDIYYKLTAGISFETRELPQQICLKCFEKINEINAFSVQCKEANISLTKCLNEFKRMKEEQEQQHKIEFVEVEELSTNDSVIIDESQIKQENSNEIDNDQNSVHDEDNDRNSVHDDENEEMNDTNDEEINKKLLPEKSRNRYAKELRDFNDWREKKNFSPILNESVILAYLINLSKNYKASSLWTKFSMLKKAFIVADDVDISRFGKVMAFMKKQNVNVPPKKSKVLSVADCRKFILEASDDFLLCKVVLIFGLYGACRVDELLKLKIDDIEDHEKYVLVKLHDTRTRSFIIPDASESLNPYQIYQKYAKLRPGEIESKRFFLGYRQGKCINQPAGMHTLGGVPRKVAEFLGLDHPENYTGHCLRRTGASMFAQSSGNILQYKAP